MSFSQNPFFASLKFFFLPKLVSFRPSVSIKHLEWYKHLTFS